MIMELSEPLIVGDEHNTARNLDRTVKLYDGIEELGKDTIHLGDIFHTKEKVSSKTLNLVYKKLKESKLKHVLIVGNHDWHSLECQDHSLQVLKELPNVLIIDQPTSLMVGNQPIYFLPYYHDLQKFKLAVNSPESKKCKILIMHQGVTGFDYGNGYIAVDELELEALTKFDKVISGHFHKYQNKGNLIYLGTPYSTDFGESNQIKYMAILKGFELELFETAFPRHYTHTLECPVTELHSFGEGFHRAFLTGNKEDIELFPKDKYPGVKFIERPTNLGGALEFTDKLSNEAKFQLWAKDRIDPETEKLGLEILTEVR